MSFLPAVSVLALLTILPVLLSLEGAAAGTRELSAGCALSAAAIGLMTVAAALAMPLAAVLGYAALIAAVVFIFLAFRRLLALAAPPAVFIALALAAGATGLVVAISSHGDAVARVIVGTGLGGCLLLVIGLPTLDRRAAAKPAFGLAAVAALTIACVALIHALSPMPAPALHAAPSPAATYEFSLAVLQTLGMPSLFLAFILTLQTRVIADLRSAIARDELTGVLSRAALIEKGERVLAFCLSRRCPASFLLLDLDYFKQINDHYGHACGDMALAHFAGTVSNFLGDRGAFGRIGGEEFGIVLPNHTEEQAAALAEAVCRLVRETPAGRAHQRIRLTVSIGIAAAESGDSFMDVMIRADMALYVSKADGRDRCSIARHRHADASARALAAAAAQLRQADGSGRERLRQSA